MEEAKFVAMVRGIGGRVFLVGGWVRDMLRGAEAQDKDYVVSGLTEKQFCGLFPDAKKVGRSFPVYLTEIDGKSCEVAFARRERKTGAGYTGFTAEFSPETTIEEDLWRRDTTMNSMAMELPEKTIIDPYHGREDIEARQIRAVSRHFTEDPVRALRAARQSAQLNFMIAEDTYAYLRACREELAGEPQERLLHEFTLALAAPRPSIFFRSLQRAGLLETAFPEIHALLGKTQPTEFHPEGDAFEHVMKIADEVSAATDDLCVRFCGLCHDLGKGMTPMDMLPHHYGHEERGLAALAAWDRRCALPKDWRQAAAFIIAEHMRAPRLEKPGKIVDLLLAIHHSHLDFDGFRSIIRADHGSLPDYLEYGEQYLDALLRVSGRDCPSGLNGEAVGKWLRTERIRCFLEARKEICRES